MARSVQLQIGVYCAMQYTQTTPLHDNKEFIQRAACSSDSLLAILLGEKC